MSEPYKAHGRQLEVHPDAKGMTIEKWEASASLVNPKELAEYMKKRTILESKPKTTKAMKSGALPGNTEWL